MNYTFSERGLERSDPRELTADARLYPTGRRAR